MLVRIKQDARFGRMIYPELKMAGGRDLILTKENWAELPDGAYLYSELEVKPEAKDITQEILAETKVEIIKNVETKPVEPIIEKTIEKESSIPKENIFSRFGKKKKHRM